MPRQEEEKRENEKKDENKLSAPKFRPILASKELTVDGFTGGFKRKPIKSVSPHISAEQSRWVSVLRVSRYSRRGSS